MRTFVEWSFLEPNPGRDTTAVYDEPLHGAAGTAERRRHRQAWPDRSEAASR